MADVLQNPPVPGAAPCLDKADRDDIETIRQVMTHEGRAIARPAYTIPAPRPTGLRSWALRSRQPESR
jgi:hypothetical protein